MQQPKMPETSFTDPDFPAAARSLYHKVGHRPSTHQIAHWRRPDEAHPDLRGSHALFVSGSAAGDVVQGFLGDCYFLGALSVVATRPELLRRVFDESRCDAEAGRYVARFFKDGAWVDVEVDDRLPCLQDGEFAYARCADRRELWVPLLEKAYAKLHGTYQMLEGGSVAEALVDLTGGCSEVIDLRTEAGRKDVATGKLWGALESHAREGFLMGCGVASDARAVEGDAGSGLIANHAYAVIDVRKVGAFRLLRIRNPWGRGEWTGNWCDGSPMWTDAIKRELGYEFADDGTFWMEFDDFARRFNKIYVCRIFTDNVGVRFDRHDARGEWVGLDAGGCLDHGTWRSNPQWLVHAAAGRSGPFECFVSVSQEDARVRRRTEYKNAIGVYVFRTNRAVKKLDVRDTERVADSGFSYTRGVSVGFTVEPGQSYVLMPCGFTPEQEGTFAMSVFGEERINVQRLQEPRKATLSGEWRGPAAGGCPNYPSWVRNPQFYVMPVRPQAQFTIVLRQHGVGRGRQETPTHAIGFQVARCTTNNRLTLLMGDSIIGQSEYVEGASVSAVVHTKDDTRFPYVIVPSTFYPSKFAKFDLTVYCDTPFAFAAAPEGSVFEDLDRVLSLRAEGAAEPDPEDTAGFSSTRRIGGPAVATPEVPDKFVSRPDNPLYRTSNMAFGARPMAHHEKPVKVFGRSQGFSRSHAGNFRGTGMN